MDRGAWQDIVYGVPRVGYDLTTKPPKWHEWAPPPSLDTQRVLGQFKPINLVHFPWLQGWLKVEHIIDNLKQEATELPVFHGSVWNRFSLSPSDGVIWRWWAWNRWSLQAARSPLGLGDWVGLNHWIKPFMKSEHILDFLVLWVNELSLFLKSVWFGSPVICFQDRKSVV